jgi:hypothetical protein
MHVFYVKQISENIKNSKFKDFQGLEFLFSNSRTLIKNLHSLLHRYLMGLPYSACQDQGRRRSTGSHGFTLFRLPGPGAPPEATWGLGGQTFKKGTYF